MRDASHLALSAALAAALLGITSAGSAQAVPPAWSPPPSIAPMFGSAPPASAPVAAPPTTPELRLDDADVALRATFGIGNAPASGDNAHTKHLAATARAILDR